MKIRILTLLVLLFCLGPVLRAQGGNVNWSTEAVQVEDSIYELVFSGKPEAGWHTYGTAAEYSAPEISFVKLQGCEAVGGLYDISKPVMQDGEPVFAGPFKIGQKIKVTGSGPVAEGVLTYVSCTDGACTPPTDWEFSVSVAAGGGSSRS